LVFSKIGLYHLRGVYKNHKEYRKWLFRFILWGHNVHKREFTIQQTYDWDIEIKELLNEAEELFPLVFMTIIGHYLVHIPAGLRYRGPLLLTGMYGLERFGDWFIKMTKATVRKHVSMCHNYVLKELCAFLKQHDADTFGDLGVTQTLQPHMVSLHHQTKPLSWSVTGALNKSFHLTYDTMIPLMDIYFECGEALGVSIWIGPEPTLSSFFCEFASNVQFAAAFIRGQLWTGARYFQSLPNGYDAVELGRGHCVISFNIGEGLQFGIIRKIILHRPFLSKECPRCYFFCIEVVRVEGPVSDVPLPSAFITEEICWASTPHIMHDKFMLMPNDDDSIKPECYYLVDFTT
jgi:hypothetical protein